MYPNFCFYRNSQKSALYTSQLVIFHKTSLLKMSERKRLKFEWRRPGVLEKPNKLGGMPPRLILKTRAPKMPFPAIWVVIPQFCDLKVM